MYVFDGSLKQLPQSRVQPFKAMQAKASDPRGERSV